MRPHVFSLLFGGDLAYFTLIFHVVTRWQRSPSVIPRYGIADIEQRIQVQISRIRQAPRDGDLRAVLAIWLIAIADRGWSYRTTYDYSQYVLHDVRLDNPGPVPVTTLDALPQYLDGLGRARQINITQAVRACRVEHPDSFRALVNRIERLYRQKSIYEAHRTTEAG